MPSTTSAEASLINNTEFLFELAQFAPGDQAPAVESSERTIDQDEFHALDRGLPESAAAPDAVAGPRDAAAFWESDAPAANRPASVDRHFPMAAAAIIVAACLTAGAAGAAYLFQDRFTTVTARFLATR